jgi:hypothetical protein
MAHSPGDSHAVPPPLMQQSPAQSSGPSHALTTPAHTALAAWQRDGETKSVQQTSPAGHIAAPQVTPTEPLPEQKPPTQRSPGGHGRSASQRNVAPS